MPKSSTGTESKRNKQRTQVKDLPKKEKELTSKEQKKVKGGEIKTKTGVIWGA